MRIEDFLVALLAKCPEGIDYDSMTSEWYPYREWSNPPQRGRFMTFRIDGPSRPRDSEDRSISIYYKWPHYDIDCPNPPTTVSCIAFRTISGSQSFNEFPDEACNEALDKLPPLMVKKCDQLEVVEPLAVCIADAYVAQSGGGYNTSELKAEENGDDKYLLLGFQLPPDIDPATIEKLELEMYVKDYGGDYDWEGSDYYGDTMFFNALPAFNESTVNWSWHFNNRIYLGQDVLKTPFQKNAYYKILNVGMEALSHLTADKKLYFSWKGSDTWQTYSSKEGDHPPKLIIHFKEPE